MNKKFYLTHHLLVAMPSLQDGTFAKSVVYIYEHNAEGAMGVVINKPMHVSLSSMLKHLDIKITGNILKKHQLLMGGPVGQDHGFILYVNEQNTIEISAAKELLEKIAHGQGPRQFLVTLGYSGWAAGQLEKEISQNDWLVVPAYADLVFHEHISNRWRLSASSIGVDINQISTQVGHG